MKCSILTVLFCQMLGVSASPVDASPIDKDALAKSYFSAWVKTQSPKATAEDIERYLDLLADDVGHQHLPYDVDASRHVVGKKEMRKGIMHYLGSHTRHSARLNTITHGFNLVVISYESASTGVHPQTAELIEQRYDTVEVLELVGDKVAVIRKYSE
ncbi:MAG: hypothetical protein ACJAQ6_000280 [Arenicella sp.]|jgi:hypothetical protein